jgi:hypothetical protein
MKGTRESIISFLKERGAKVTEGKGFVHADFPRERNAELTAKVIRENSPEMRMEEVYGVLKIYL